VVDRENKERIDIQWQEVKTVDEIMRECGPGQIAGANVTMGQPQVINLSRAGLSGDLNQQIQQAMRQAQEGTSPSIQPEATSAAAPEPSSAPAPDSPRPNMVEERLAALERLAACATPAS